MKKIQFILATTLIAATIIGAIADSADARRYSSAGRSRDGGNDIVDFDIELDFEDELVPGLYPDAISNYLHTNVGKDIDGDGTPEPINIFSNPGQTYDLLIKPCCSNPELIDDGVDDNGDGIADDEAYIFGRQDVARNLPNSFNPDPLNPTYFETADNFLQYTILIDSASTDLAGFETINNGIFSFVIDESLGLTGVSQIKDEFNNELDQTFGSYQYEQDFEENLDRFEALGVGFTSSSEVVPEASSIFSLISLGIIGTGLLLKRRLT